MRPPSFDHRDDGTPAADWTELIAQLPPTDGAGAHDHLLVLAAHPDDETLGAGGLIADAASAGAQVTVVVATDGEASHPRSPTHSPEALRDIRRAELRDAVHRLAPHARVVRLGLPDAAVAEHVDELRRAVADAAADVTLVAAPWRHDGHPDHDACGAVAASVTDATGARLLEYPVWAWHWGTPGRSGPGLDTGWTARTMSRAARRAKTAAAGAHRSQHSPLSPQPGDESLLSASMLAHFASEVEVFRASTSRDLTRSYFDRLYRRDADPWGIATGFYEHRKRDLLLAALPRPRFARAFEPGCASGLTTVALAVRCDAVVAQDISATAVAATTQRLRGAPHVDITTGAVPDDWPDGRFDLVALSELGYYLADPGLLAERVRASLTPDGVVAAVHWRHPAPGYPSTAEAVHEALGRGLHRLVAHIEEDFLLDVWSVDGVSVARAGGLLP